MRLLTVLCLGAIMIGVKAEAKLKYKSGQCQAIDLQIEDASKKIIYPLTHYELDHKAPASCEKSVSENIKHYCHWYPQRRSTASEKERLKTDFVISGKIGYFQEHYHLATVKGNCENFEITWRKDN